MNNYSISVFDNGNKSNVEVDSKIKVADIYTEKYIYMSESNSDYTVSGVYAYDFSGEEVFNLKFQSSSYILDICNDENDNTCILYYSESDYDTYFGKYDSEGTLINVYNLSEIIEFESFEGISNIAVDRNDDVYIITCDYETSEYRLLKYNSDFTSCLFENDINDAGNVVDDIFIDKSGNLILSGYDESYCYVNLINTQSNICEKYIELPDVKNIFNSNDNSILYIMDGEINSYDTVTDEETVITKVTDTVVDMYCYDDILIYCCTDNKLLLNFRVSDINNNISYEETVFLSKDFHIHDKCFSNDKKMYMMLCNNETYKLGVFDEDYTEYEISLDTASDDSSDNHFVEFNLVSNGENIYFLYDNDIYEFNIPAQDLKNITNKKYQTIKDICLSGERLFVLYSDNESVNIGEYSKSENQIKKLISTQIKSLSDIDSILPGYGEYIFCLNAGNKLCGYKEDLKTDVIIDWNNAYMQLYIDSFSMLEKDKFLCIGEDEEVYILENNHDKITTQLNVAIFGATTAVYNQCMQNLSEQFDITVKKYSDYDQNSDGGFGQFNLDIASGNIPDIIISQGSSNLDLYRQKGLLESLDKYIENDSLINREDYIQSVLELDSFDGNLYYITPEIFLKTVISQESMENPGNPDFSDFYNLLSNKYSGYGNNVLGTKSREYILNTFLSTHKDLQNVSHDKAYDVDNEDFRAILKTAKEYGLKNGFDTMETIAENFKNDKQIFALYNIPGFDYFNIYEKYVLGEKISFNAPSADSSDNIAIECRNSLCITSSCKNKEAAWAFVRTFIMDDYQNNVADQVHFGFPIKYSALNRAVDNSQNPDYTPENLLLGDEKIKVGHISNETAEELISRIEKCNLKCKMDARVMAIIDEEAMLYFEDVNTIDQTIENINSKINIYINEIK